MRTLLLSSLLLLAAAARAEIYELPPEGFDVIGAVTTITARHEDTLVDIARRHGLGYQDIVRANPDVNPWVPGEGTEVVLPTRFVLPPGPRKGLVLNLAEYRMYYFPVPRDGEPALVMTYPISIGRMDWETPLGNTSVVAMARDPAWYPPQSVRDEHAADGDPLPRVVPAGPNNPLGTRAIRLGLPGYLIHGTNRPAGVGMRVSHGCIRMLPEDIEFLFELVGVKTPVRIINEPIKIGWEGDTLVMEAHPVLESAMPDLEDLPAELLEQMDAAELTELPAVAVAVKNPLTMVTEKFIAATNERAGQLDWRIVELLIERSSGVPDTVGAGTKTPRQARRSSNAL
ncbi:MAG: L,D-transpeptidase family protein [Woeseiaceae bacterium]